MAARRAHRAGGGSGGNQAFAVVAARFLAADEAADFEDARRRAARELGIDERREGADNRAIQRALAEHLALFERDALRERLARQRNAARRALDALSRFHARLVGAVWYGTATAATPITLHLESDETEAVTRFLLERHITYHLADRRYRFPGGAQATVPCFEVQIDDEDFDLVVFPSHGSLRVPLSPLDARPVRRAGAAELDQLIASGCLFSDELAGLD